MSGWSRGLALCLVALAGASGCRRGDQAEAVAEAARQTTPTVSVSPVTGQDDPVTIEATGSFQAEESSEVAPEVSGRVMATPVDVGQFVQSGSVLVRLQGIDAGLRLEESRAATARAEANLKLAESQDELSQTTAQRYASLLATGDVSRTVADQARTQAATSIQNVATARASLAEARAQLAMAEKAVTDVVVAAPFAGYIGQRHVSLGEYVQPSTAVVTLLKVDPLRLQLTLPGIQAARVKIGQQVIASVDTFPGKSFTGKITSVNPAIAAESRTFMVEARVPNPAATLKPGMFAVATIDQGTTERSLLVPKRAVIEDANTNSFRVFTIDEKNVAHIRVIQLAARQQGDLVRLLGGVKEGERVATSSLADLYDGAQVTVGAAGRD